MVKNEHPIIKWTTDKTLKNTGRPQQPFYSVINKEKRLYIFGVLVWKGVDTGDFPEGEK